jgi:hypothetical protein
MSALTKLSVWDFSLVKYKTIKNDYVRLAFRKILGANIISWYTSVSDNEKSLKHCPQVELPQGDELQAVRLVPHQHLPSKVHH